VYTRDTDQINRELDDFRVGLDGRNILLLTYDIVRLYPSIKHELCYGLLEKHLHGRGCRYTSFIVAALRIILNRNYCTFNGQTWRQHIGFATGIACGAEVANLFIYVLTRFVFRRHQEYISLHRRFIDDGFILWTGTRDAALEMLTELNQLDSDIRLTHELSATQAIFLDLFIWKGSRFKLLGAFDTKTYQKPMNRHLYTPYCTAAPEHTKLSVVHTELRRYIKRSSARADYIMIATALRERLSMRGHPNWFLQQAFSSGPHYEDRQKILAGKSAAAITAAKKPVIVFATTYFRTLEQSGLSRAIFLNQPYLPGYLLREVNFLNAWRASRKLAALLICYDFFKISNRIRTDSPERGNMCYTHTAAEQLLERPSSDVDSMQLLHARSAGNAACTEQAGSQTADGDTQKQPSHSDDDLG